MNILTCIYKYINTNICSSKARHPFVALFQREVYICIHMYVYICTYIYIHIYVRICSYIHMNICIHATFRRCGIPFSLFSRERYVYKYLCIDIHIYIYIYISIFIFTREHIYTYIQIYVYTCI